MLEIKAIYASGWSTWLDVSDYKLSMYKDIRRSREFQFTAPKSAEDGMVAYPPEFSEILVYDDGILSFRGYVERNEIKSSNRICYCKGVEELLRYRVTPRFNYCFADYTLDKLMRDSHSATTTDGMGLLFVANSLMPPASPYSIYDATDNIIKFEGAGWQSRLGKEPVMWQQTVDGVYKLTQVTTVGDINAAGKYALTPTDLYLRPTTTTKSTHFHKYPQNGWIYAQDCFDTKIRLGDCPTDEIQGGVNTGQSIVRNLIADLVEAHGYTMRFREDGVHTKLDVLEDSGRGEDVGLYTLVDDDLITLTRQGKTKPRSHALIGYSDGAQYYSSVNFAHKGFFVVDTHEVSGGHADSEGILEPYTEDEMDARELDYLYRIETTRDLQVVPGDYINLQVTGTPRVLLPIEVLEKSSSEVLSLQLGGKIPDSVDMWRARSSMDSAYIDGYLWVFREALTGSTTTKFADDVHDNTAGSMNFVVPTGVKDSDKHSRILLDVSLSISSWVENQLHRWGVLITVDDKANQYTVVEQFLLGEAIQGLDVTDIVTANATNVVKVKVWMYGDWEETHSGATDHKTVSVSATMRFYKRLFVP
jgi:hypothetical protein